MSAKQKNSTKAGTFAASSQPPTSERSKQSKRKDQHDSPKNAHEIVSMGVENLLMPSSSAASNANTSSASSADGVTALRSSISELYRLGVSLHKPMDNFHYLSQSIATAGEVPKKKAALSFSDNFVTTEQIWGQLSMLGAPVLNDIGVNLGKLNSAFGDAAESKKAKRDESGAKKKSVAFDDEFDDEDLDDLVAEEDEEMDEEEFEEGDESEGDEDEMSSDASSEGLEDDAHLSKLIMSRQKNQKDKKNSAEAKRQKALLDFAAGGDDGEDDDDEWAAEFETRKDEDGDNDGDEDFGGMLGEEEEDEEGAGEEGEEDEEDGDIMAEMYGDEYDGEDNTLFGENEEDEDVHGTSDEEANEDDDDDNAALYDAEEDARFQKGMFPTDNDDGFDNILDDREGQFHHTNNALNTAEEEEDEDGLTDFQLRQKQEKKFISELEQKRAFNADWAMTGEVEGRARPKDSLVDEELDFEHGMKSVPVITEALTAKLEDRIKKRIADNNFNDVVRRAPTTTGADLTSQGTAAKRDPAIDAEKSKASLMDLYEKDYLAKLKRMEDAAGMNENVAEPLTEVEKDELKAIQMWKRLAQHLDALSNYYFTPKPVQEDLNVRVRAVDKAAPAISMEAVGAFAVSKASAIAPQDTFRPSQKQMLGNVSLEEMTPRERQALRRAKKEASATTKERVERQTAERKKRRVEAEAAKAKK